MIDEKGSNLRKIFKLKKGGSDINTVVSLETFASGDISKIKIKLVGTERERLIGHMV